MSNPVPPWEFRASSGGKQVKGSSRNATDGAVLPVSGAHHSNSWFQISDSSTTNGSEADSFRDILGLLSHAPLHSTSQAASTTVPGRDSVCAVDEGESSGKKRTSDGVLNRRCYSEGLDAICEELKTKVNDRPKRTRSAELHNMSERRRRDRIKEKMRALQELIPNCNKLDRASMLDDAISYLKLLKLQVEMLSMGGGALCQVPCMSPAGIHNTQFPQLSPFVPLRPGIGMGLGAGVGMVGVCYSPTLHASLSAAAGLPLISAPGNISVPQVQVPFIHSQSLPEVAAPSSLLPAFVTGFSPACNCSNQGLYSSQNIATGVTDYQANPIFSNSEM